jgi:hypothetical protein
MALLDEKRASKYQGNKRCDTGVTPFMFSLEARCERAYGSEEGFSLIVSRG